MSPSPKKTSPSYQLSVLIRCVKEFSAVANSSESDSRYTRWMTRWGL